MKTIAATHIDTAVAAAAALAASAGLMSGTGAAGAVTLTRDSRFTEVWLSHEETVQAAQMGLARFLDQPAINAHTTGGVRRDSPCFKTMRSVDGQTTFVVSHQDIVAEAASKPGGQAVLYFDPARLDRPIGGGEYWPTPTQK